MSQFLRGAVTALSWTWWGGQQTTQPGDVDEAAETSRGAECVLQPLRTELSSDDNDPREAAPRINLIRTPETMTPIGEHRCEDTKRSDVDAVELLRIRRGHRSVRDELENLAHDSLGRRRRATLKEIRAATSNTLRAVPLYWVWNRSGRAGINSKHSEKADIDREPVTEFDRALSHALRPAHHTHKNHLHEIVQSLRTLSLGTDASRAVAFDKTLVNRQRFSLPIIGWNESGCGERASSRVASTKRRKHEYLYVNGKRTDVDMNGCGNTLYRMIERQSGDRVRGVANANKMDAVKYAFKRVGTFVEANLPDGVRPVSTFITRTTHARIRRGAAYNDDSRRMEPLTHRNWAMRGKYGCWQGDLRRLGHDCVTVDLGAEMRVTHVSIAGRAPSHQMFPSRACSAVARVDGTPVWNAVPVLCDSMWNPEHFGEWVTSFDLLARRVGGKWFRVGRYHGNSDAFTEEVRDVAFDLCNVPVRFVRFVPRTFHNNVSMQVDVYVNADDPKVARNYSTARSKRPKKGASKRAANRSARTGNVPTVTYEVEEPVRITKQDRACVAVIRDSYVAKKSALYGYVHNARKCRRRRRRALRDDVRERKNKYNANKQRFFADD